MAHLLDLDGPTAALGSVTPKGAWFTCVVESTVSDSDLLPHELLNVARAARPAAGRSASFPATKGIDARPRPGCGTALAGLRCDPCLDATEELLNFGSSSEKSLR